MALASLRRADTASQRQGQWFCSSHHGCFAAVVESMPFHWTLLQRPVVFRSCDMENAGMKSSGVLMSRGSQHCNIAKHPASEANGKARELRTGLLEVVSSVRTASAYYDCCTEYRAMVAPWAIHHYRTATIAALPAPRHLQRGFLRHSGMHP